MFLDSYMKHSGDRPVGPRGWLVGGVSVLSIINGWAAVHVLIMRRRDVCGCPLPGSHGRGLDAPHVGSSNSIQPRTPYPLRRATGQKGGGRGITRVETTGFCGTCAAGSGSTCPAVEARLRRIYYAALVRPVRPSPTAKKTGK